MRYPKKYSGKLFELSVDSLVGRGGLEDPPFAISGKRLADCRNVWWERGALRARPDRMPAWKQHGRQTNLWDMIRKRWYWILERETGGRLAGSPIGGTDSRFQASVIFTDRDGHPCQWETA